MASNEKRVGVIMCFAIKYDCVVTCVNSELNVTAFATDGLSRGCEIACSPGVHLADPGIVTGVLPFGITYAHILIIVMVGAVCFLGAHLLLMKMVGK